MISVLIVDDHKILRDGLKALLKSDKDIAVVGECDNGVQALEFLKSNKAQIILMDINLPVKNGIETTEEISKLYKESRVIALSMHNEERYISKMLRAGAWSYVLKDSGGEEIHEAIRKVAAGENYFTKEITATVMSHYLKPENNAQKTTLKLTKREIEVLKLIVAELTNSEISEKLFISPRTVDTHRQNILQKLNVKNTAGIVRFAIQNGLID